MLVRLLLVHESRLSYENAIAEIAEGSLSQQALAYGLVLVHICFCGPITRIRIVASNVQVEKNAVATPIDIRIPYQIGTTSDF